MKIFVRSFKVRASMEQVAEFHRDARALRILTPPPVIVQFHQIDPLADGSIVDFTLWLGPLPVRWVAEHNQVSPQAGFVDQQVKGPFRLWIHQHAFKRLGDELTEVTDEIQAQPSKHPFWGLVSWFMWVNLPVLFAYRAWRTQRALEKGGK